MKEKKKQKQRAGEVEEKGKGKEKSRGEKDSLLSMSSSPLGSVNPRAINLAILG
jgi:hypothetical protein